VLTLRLPSHSNPSGRWQVDIWGIVLFTGVVAPLILALERAQHLDPSALPTVLGLVALAILALVLLIRREQSTSSPLLPILLAAAGDDLAQRCVGGVPRRRAGLAHHLPADLPDRGPGHLAVANRPVVAAVDDRDRIGSMVTGRMVTYRGGPRSFRPTD